MQTRSQSLLRGALMGLMFVPIFLTEIHAEESNVSANDCLVLQLDPSSKSVPARRERYFQNGGVDIITSRMGIDAETVTACVQRAIQRTLAASEYFYRFALEPSSVVEVPGKSEGNQRLFLFVAHHQDHQLMARGEVRLEISTADPENLEEGEAEITCRFSRPEGANAKLVFALAWNPKTNVSDTENVPAAVEREMFFGIRKYLATNERLQGTVTDQPFLSTQRFTHPCGGGETGVAL